MPYFVYLLKSLKDKKYYIGQTENIHSRLKRHNSCKVKSTKARVPFILVGYQVFNSRNDARWFENQLKNSSDKKEVFIRSCEWLSPTQGPV